MKLKKLLKDLEVQDIRGSKEVEITGVSCHSKSVAPGNLFIARRGNSHHGMDFISEAIQAGAVAVLTEMFDPFLEKVTQIVHPDVCELGAELAFRFFHNPCGDLFTVGVTGTGGKTTSSYLIKQLFDSLSKPCGLLGTIEYVIGTKHLTASRTTPEVVLSQKLLRDMVTCGCKAAVMEVSSHGLALGRAEGLHFNVGVFTNLSPEHLDFHEDMEDYFQAKAALFQKTDRMVVNGDDPYGRRLIEGANQPALSFGLGEGVDLRAVNIEMGMEGSRITLEYQGEQVPLFSRLVGKFNVLNNLAAVGVGLQAGFSLAACCKALEGFQSVPGRMEWLQSSKGVQVVVDYAHKQAALENVLKTLQPLKFKKIITVFGCGGNRDRQKRPEMAKVSGALSDYTIVTSDNPRFEDPMAICEEIATGFAPGDQYHITVQRRDAILEALDMAEPGDCVLIAGKGHETYQEAAGRTLPFDDRKVATENVEAGVAGHP